MMTTAVQYAILGGLLVGAGVAVVLWLLVPAQPDLADVLHRYSPAGARERSRHETDQADVTGSFERLGVWGLRHLPARVWGTIPTHELALLRIPVPRFHGKKIAYALLGLVVPPLLSYCLLVLGLHLPFVIPVIGSIALAVFLFISPNLDLKAEAKVARGEFRRALTAYADLVALERVAGAGPEQALKAAANVGDSWVFVRLREELARSAWRGIPPWDGLHQLADELGLPELQDLADIMRLSPQGAQTYGSLRARSASMRDAMLNEDIAQANRVGERLYIPGTLLGLVFILMLLTPALLRLLGM